MKTISLLLSLTVLANFCVAQRLTVLDLGNRKATVKKIDTLPYIRSDYTQRFTFDRYDNPKLKQLRQKYDLDKVIATGKDEFDKQILLMDWVHHRFKKFGRPSAKPQGALEILRDVEAGHTFYCAHYAKVYVSAAASMGWVDRSLALRRHQGVAVGGSTEHTTTEIWSNQHRKWVMLDPTANMYIEKKGVPLNAYEIRTEWFYHAGKDLVFVIGKQRKKYRKTDLPIFLARFKDFGDLTVPADELDKYGFIGYIPNTNLMDAREDYGRMFIVKDKLCDGTQWHQRTLPKNPAVDPYFPIGQAAIHLAAGDGAIKVTLTTMTPNFKEFQVRIDDGSWRRCGENIQWEVHSGINTMSARALNQFGVEGPISTAVVEVPE